MKSYKKGLVFFVTKILKDITNNNLNLAKVFSNVFSLSHLKPMPHFIPILPSILELSRLVRSLSPLKTSKEKTYDIANYWTVKFIFCCINYKVFMESSVTFRNG